MLKDAIERIRAGNPDARTQAALVWAESNNLVKLRLLASIYRKDGNLHLQELSQEASKAAQELEIREHYARMTNPIITDLHDIYSTAMLGDRIRATESLCMALDNHPTLKTDLVIADFAGQLVSMPPAEAMALLTDPQKRDDLRVAKGAKWWKRRAMQAQNITWKSAGLGLAVYGVVVTLSVGALWLFVNDIWLPKMLASQAQLPSIFRQLAALSATALILIPVIFIVRYISDALIFCCVIHVAAVAMDGDGTLLMLIRRLVPFLTVAAVVVSIILVLALLTIPPEVFSLSLDSDFSSLIDTGLRLVCVLPFGLLILIFFIGGFVQETYNFGLINGVGAVIIGLIGTVILTLPLNWIVDMLFKALQSA